MYFCFQKYMFITNLTKFLKLTRFMWMHYGETKHLLGKETDKQTLVKIGDLFGCWQSRCRSSVCHSYGGRHWWYSCLWVIHVSVSNPDKLIGFPLPKRDTLSNYQQVVDAYWLRIIYYTTVGFAYELLSSFLVGSFNSVEMLIKSDYWSDMKLKDKGTPVLKCSHVTSGEM